MRTRTYTPQPLAEGQHIQLEQPAVRHASQVLRMRTGDSLTLFNGNGLEYRARIVCAQRQRLEAKILEAIGPEEPAPVLRLSLIQGISKGDRMDYVLQKAVELGVQQLSPVFTERTLVKLDERRLARRMEHWHRIVIGACEQSGRCRLPQLDRAVDLATMLEGLSQQALKLLLDHRASESIQYMSPVNSEVILLIGPEGGLTSNERDRAKQKGFISLRLGPRIMRTETAPLAALAAVQTLWGDFR